MAPIKLKEIVTFSSQDDQHRAENLLKSQSQWNRWLCAPDDRSGCIQMEVQLERAEQIGYIDIGNYGSNTVEIQVRRSYATDSGFQSILPATMFRTVEESRYGKCKCAVKMFNRDHFIEAVKDQKWDRVKVICRDLSRKVPQFGLAFLSFSSTKAADKPAVNASPRTTHVKVSYKKGKSPKVVVPAWKKDAAFYRQYMETNMSGEAGPSELRERILKMSSSSGDGSPGAGSFGRSAKMLLASSGSGTNLREITNCQSSPVPTPTRYHPSSPSTTPSQVKSTPTTTPTGGSKTILIQFRKKLQVFIREQGRNIAYASMKALRATFEEQLGYKMDKAMREEFKAAMLEAAESALSSTATLSSESVTRTTTLENLTPEQKTPSEEKAGPIKRKIFSERDKSLPTPKIPKKQIQSQTHETQKVQTVAKTQLKTRGTQKEKPVTKTPKQSVRAQQPKTPQELGATAKKRQPKTPKGLTKKEKDIFSKAMSSKNQKTPQQSEGLTVPGDLKPPGKLGTPPGPANQRKTVEQSGPKPIKAKKPPASAYRECPRCFGKFTASQMNIHIANCVPDHGRIARAALGALAESISSSPSPGNGQTKESPESLSSTSGDDSFTSLRQTPSRPDGKKCMYYNTDVDDHPSNSKQGSSSTSKSSRSLKRGSVPSILDKGFLSNEPDLVPCPICWIYFEPYLIELHASTCGAL